ncbi:hypothetical protein ACFOOM_19590 [Streptomyces echinoruber]|uniref:Uncharacterized protein n=1 Tax=Streptomyces echinoruber TaxID=68898 RepID=A0A918VR41_9ACTN|nr:hypothetical protein [Streptomyces echinoruber]GHA16129.1 hypothetical protein GCM10010389_63360 [Streptomyces echinoruber]
MAFTDHRTMRRVLRREIAGIIGLLTDEHDFRAMRRYRTFSFDNHRTYLQQTETVLKTRAAQGTHTTLALFDPQEYADFCAETGLAPDDPASRTRFTAELAITGATVPYDGRPLTELLPALVDEAVRQATWEYASTLLARLGPCPSCGEDIGRAAFSRATALLTRILETAPPGNRHLVCSVASTPETLDAVLHADQDADGTTRLDEAEALEFTTVLALGLATGNPGGLVMRTTAPDTPDRVYGWRLRGDTLRPLTAGEVFDAYCTDAESGDLISPESGVDYCEPPDLGEEGLHRHRH